MALVDNVALYALGYAAHESHPMRLDQYCLNTVQQISLFRLRRCMPEKHRYRRKGNQLARLHELQSVRYGVSYAGNP